MRFYRQLRQVHLWIGLLTSVLILIEAVTGLLMAEPWLMGVSKPSKQISEAAGHLAGNPGMGRMGGEFKGGHDITPGGSGNSIMHFVRNLHAGRIGNTDISLLLDLVAIGLIILTMTGIILSVRALKLQSTARK
ncbi:PepSY domain-containing protein [Desulforamulus hydrothermalis]|uniref:PepSY-associated TM helix domain protein n=1 Tax=Desulforamulus hydrothermalis Lam5 = DSM 18033 TaxID=1121428 RepID=K8DYZ3_9FIRM|nr:PepSY domain-containing protein [Desulforamulus hydrothermalis]CCO08159.1 conserved hypothetical protein [Desulforamulus hydrothermalis Lam5 = DSM 18033]SHH23510.1 hypothetical protein SAMN02745177_01922 [Desulforamulus hydrothermalis Lam5 = DSM 18033]